MRGDRGNPSGTLAPDLRCADSLHPRPAKAVPIPTNKSKSAGKPGSVTGRAVAHPMAVIHLGVALPRRSSHLPADLASSLGLNLFVRLLGVAPDGGCRVSPAPDLGVSLSRGDSSLWPCSSPSSNARAIALLRLGVTQHPALRSPDFPLPALVFTGGQRRSGWLRTRMVARRERRFFADALSGRSPGVEAPAQCLSRPQGHQRMLPERIRLWNDP
jgi:hypothetical protein